MDRIRVGLIGLGRSGRDIHGKHLATDDRFQIVAAADFLEKRRRRAAAEYGCEVFPEYEAIAARRDLDLVVNASYSHLHVPISLALLQAGQNVLSEKPLAARASDVDRLIEASRKAGKVLAIYQQSRYAPYFLKLREVIDSGVLGRIVQISIAFNGFSRRWDWQTVSAFLGGNLLNTGPHPLDQALVLFGPGEPVVHAFMDRTEEGSFGDAENHVKLILSGKGHPLIDLEVSSCCAYPHFLYNVYGSRGGLSGNATSLSWRYFRPEEAPPRALDTDPICDSQGLPAYISETLEWHTGEWPGQQPEAGQAAYSAAAAPTLGGMSERFYGMLYRTLAEGAPLEITPEQVRRQIAVIEEARRQHPDFTGGGERA